MRILYSFLFFKKEKNIFTTWQASEMLPFCPFKELFTQKLKSSFTRPYVVPNLYDGLSSLSVLNHSDRFCEQDHLDN